MNYTLPPVKIYLIDTSSFLKSGQKIHSVCVLSTQNFTLDRQIVFSVFT